MIVVVVIVIICLLGAASVFLVMKYKAKSPEVTPSAQKQELGPHVKPGVKQKKNKHSSSTTGMYEGLEAAKAAEGRGADQKKRRRKRSSSSPKVRVGSQMQMLKGRQQSS